MKPLMVYDGDCGFCRTWIRRWRSLTNDRVDYAPFQQVGEQFPDIPPDRFRAAVHLIEPDGRITFGAEAVFRALRVGRREGAMLWLYRHVPGVACVTEWGYRLVARHRRGFATATTLLWGQHVERPTYSLVRWLFLRLLGVVYLIAFWSLWRQIIGLIGRNGIMPAAPWLEAIHSRLGAESYWRLPSVCWWNASDSFLNGLCASGMALSALLILGIAPGPVLAILWVLYLSLTAVGQQFLSFQWDALLLETGFLATFVAPWRIRPRLSRETEPSRTALWLLRWLLFRLMLLSGLTKLSAHDPAWHDLTALFVHYETQPLPTWIGWYAHQLPAWFQRASCAAMFVIELFIPFLILGTRRLRRAAFWLLIGFQMLIAATGNYGFFNLLTMVLCVPLLDDAGLRRVFPGSWRAAGDPIRPAPIWRKVIVAGLTAAIVPLSFLHGVEQVFGSASLPHFAQRALNETRPLRAVNGYGLFRVMTQRRPEIVIEGSRDGREWLVYEFQWKPGDLQRRPRFVAPHMPRLDWQMWFAALGDDRSKVCVVNLMQRMLEGTPEVLALLDQNPFPVAPPRYIRAVLYDYHFTNPTTRATTGAWWRRDRLGAYSPVLTLRRE